MPTPKRHADPAARQRAYRARKRELEIQTLTELDAIAAAAIVEYRTLHPEPDVELVADAIPPGPVARRPGC